MKLLKGVDFVAQTSTPEETLALLSELKDYLLCGTQNADSASQTSKQTTVCDRILRACIQRFRGEVDGLDHCRNLQALAEVSYRGYVSARSQYVPLYLERLLYHLLRGVAAWGPSEGCLSFADLLYAELSQYRPPQVPADDYISIAKSAFGFLWKSVDVVAKADKTSAELRTALSTHLRAVRFLLLLEHDAQVPFLQEPPFFTSIVARHASAAAVLFEAQRSPMSKEEARFLSDQFSRHLVAALLERTEKKEALAFQDCLSVFELALIRVRYLCKSGCFRESKEILQQSSGYLRKPSDLQHCFSHFLEVLSAGVGLNQVLMLGQGSVGLFFTQAAEALSTSSDAEQPLLRLLAESCQLLISPLYGYVRKSQWKPFDLQDTLGISVFMENYFRVLRKLTGMVSAENVKQKQALKKLMYNYFQLFTTIVYDSLQTLQGPERSGLPQLLMSLQTTVTLMLDMLGDLREREEAEHLDLSAYCVSRLAYSFYSHKMYVESNSIAELFCRWLTKEDLSKYPGLPTEKLQNCFKLQVENYRKLGLLEEALQAVVFWLTSCHSKVTELMAEPISCWVKIKMDASKNGADDLRLKTLKEGLEGYNLDAETLLKLLLEELKAYKTVRVDTGQERFNVICDLLDLCPEGSSWFHKRAVVLVELAQVLCYHSYNEHTECSALDSVREALRLLDAVPTTLQNEAELQDDKAQALLWLYICMIEDKMNESIKQEQRSRSAEGQRDVKALESFETNDLGYENKTHDDQFLYLGIAFNLSADSAQSKCLDDALALWKDLLSKDRITAVRSVEQTTASLHILAALYRMMGKPLQAMESYFLIANLSDALKDLVGKTNALCQIAKLLLQLECPSSAEATLKEADSCLREVDKNNDAYLLTSQTLAVLRSKLCLANHKIEEGLLLLVETLQNPALQRSAKVWYLLRASSLQLTAAYLGLPPSVLPLALGQKLYAQGWKTPEMALSDAHRLYRSILLNFSLISSSDASTKDVPEHPFVDHGDNLVQKWQVLADMFVCSESFVSLLGKMEIVSEAKAFCLEALKIAMKLQSIRWCARFLVLKSQLELQRRDLEVCRSDLEQVLFLLESSTVFETKKERGRVEIKPKKGGSKGRKEPRSPCSELSEEEAPFLREVPLEFIDTVAVQKGNTLATSPVLKSKLKKKPSFLSHPETCPCSLCSDVVLSAVCLCWMVTSSERELAVGNKAEGLGLLESSLRRCTAGALRLSNMVAGLSQGQGKRSGQPTVRFLDPLVARTYVTLTKHSLSAKRLEKKLWKLLETGLSFTSSRGSQLPGLEYQKAQLLLTKAVASISALASSQDGHPERVFAAAWSWRSPTFLRGGEETKPAAIAAEAAVDGCHPLPQKRGARRLLGEAPKAKPKRTRGTKPLPAVQPHDTFALVDSDSEVPPVILRPPVEHRTPAAQKPQSASKMSRSSATKTIRALRAPFVVFEDSSPKLNAEPPKAPKVTRRMKSRIKPLFSNDSDPEDPPEAKPEAQLPAAEEPVTVPRRAGQRAAPSRKLAKGGLAKTGGCRGSSSEAKPRPGRPGSRRAGRQGKKAEGIQEGPCEEGTCKTEDEQGQGGGGEEKELLRAIEEGLEDSLEILRGSDEDETGKECRRQPNAEDDQEVLRRDASGDRPMEVFQAANKRHTMDPFNLSSLVSSLDTPATITDFLSTGSVYDSLQSAFHSVGHYPPGSLYSHLCQLMALCIGSRDPTTTAYLVSESVAVTLRHQIMSVIHKKLNKMRKSSVASACRQLEALSLQEERADSRAQHLAELQSLFGFGCPPLTELGTQVFKEQLQQIPQGILTVCILALVSIQPDTVGDTLLLTRLRKDATPVTVQIQSQHCKMPLSAALGGA
ncbi:hypothetical protein JRQ81_003851 [Phrynocephalus forsythii]|uniref:Separase n=1 Tax=Phrynocephalus forsythii TaxID=171643 RepID=A0A9Q0XKJ3_9SAUR|nr:hypothetical protein JRQ81_003851 [Phrynocephalus forsythii]